MSSKREWAAIYSAMLLKPKYRRLSVVGRGALLHVLLHAGTTDPEASWTEPELRDILALDGFPTETLDELVALGWLDRSEDVLTVHDWDDHQYAASVEIKRRFEADRLRKWRREKVQSPSSLHSSPPDITSHHITGVRTSNVRVRTSSVEEATVDPETEYERGLRRVLGEGR